MQYVCPEYITRISQALSLGRGEKRRNGRADRGTDGRAFFPSPEASLSSSLNCFCTLSVFHSIVLQTTWPESQFFFLTFSRSQFRAREEGQKKRRFSSRVCYVPPFCPSPLLLLASQSEFQIAFIATTYVRRGDSESASNNRASSAGEKAALLPLYLPFCSAVFVARQA